MKPYFGLGLAMLAGAAFGAAAVNGLHAQAKPGAYVVVDISEITNPDLFKTYLPKTTAANQAFGGQFVVRTENITALDGVAPKRFVLISFDSVDKAKNNSHRFNSGGRRKSRPPYNARQDRVTYPRR